MLVPLLSKVKFFSAFLLLSTCGKMAGRIFQISRNFSTSRLLRASLSEPITEQKANHELATAAMWKKVFYFVCIPALVVCSVSLMLEEEHKPPEFKPYSHLRIRRKKYPWRDGIKTLFHNPHTNALPDGYEIVE